MSDSSPSSYDKMMQWLDPDPARASAKYFETVKKLSMDFKLWARLKSRYVNDASVEVLITKTFDRVEGQVISSLLGRAKVKDEKLVVFCERLYSAGIGGSLSPAKRVWELLSPEMQEVVAITAQEKEFDQKHKDDVINALNMILRRHDFYREDYFEGIKLSNEAQTTLGRGLTDLTDEEVQRFNRLLLEACFPEEVNANLADTTKYTDRYPYFKGVARNIWRENKHQFPYNNEVGVRGPREGAGPGRRDGEILEDFKRALAHCCKALKPWRRPLKLEKCDLLLLYFEEILVDPETGEVIARGSKEVREKIMELLGLTDAALRKAIHDILKKIKPCIVSWMMSNGYSVTELSRLSI